MKNQSIGMILRVLIVFFSLLGISATFMPWLHYPKVDGSFPGYLTDGIVTGFLFLLILVFALYTLKKKRLPTLGAVVFGLMGLSLSILSLSKIRSIEEEKLNFATDDAVIASVSAGFHQGIGIYVFGVAGLGVFLTILVALFMKFTQFKQPARVVAEKTKIPGREIFYAAGVLIAVLVVAWLYIRPFSLPVNPGKEQLEARFSQDIDAMGKALVSRDYNEFIDYNHPMLVQNYGGREEFRYILENTMSEFFQNGYSIGGTELMEIRDIESSGDRIQAVITQELTLRREGSDSTIIQQMLAVTEDRGENWYYLNLDQKTKDEIGRYYPYLLENIEF